MAVESFLIEEVQTLVTEQEDLAQWQKLVNECGMSGQTERSVEGKSPIPFPVMTRGMVNVYNTLCPQHEKAETYKTGTIPLRVLSLIALCKQEKYFNKLEIWHNDTKPDPILVGFPKDSWGSSAHLIARWGDELRSYPELENHVREHLLRQRRLTLKAELDGVEARVEKFISGEENNLTVY